MKTNFVSSVTHFRFANIFVFIKSKNRFFSYKWKYGMLFVIV